MLNGRHSLVLQLVLPMANRGAEGRTNLRCFVDNRRSLAGLGRVNAGIEATLRCTVGESQEWVILDSNLPQKHREKLRFRKQAVRNPVQLVRGILPDRQADERGGLLPRSDCRWHRKRYYPVCTVSRETADGAGIAGNELCAATLSTNPDRRYREWGISLGSLE